jgi:hypothetical protein
MLSLFNQLISLINLFSNNTMRDSSNLFEFLTPLLKDYDKLLRKFNSIYKQNKLIKTQNTYVPPESLILGNRFERCIVESVSRLVEKRESFEYISIKQTLEKK